MNLHSRKKFSFSFLVFFTSIFFFMRPLCSVEQRNIRILPLTSSYMNNLDVITSKENEKHIILKRQSYQLNDKQKLNSLSFFFDSDSIDGFSNVQKNLIESASYRPRRYPDSSGYSAGFDLLRHRIILDLPQFIFLSRSDSTGDFSIQMNIRFSQLGRSMEIFRKIGIFEGRKQGIRAIFENNNIVFEFYNLFWNQDIPLELWKIRSRDAINENRFYSVLLNYNESDGSLTLYLDGLEQARFFLTANFAKGGTILTPKFHRWDRSKMLIGENFFGAIDDLILSNEILPYQQNAGTYGMVKRIGNRFEQSNGVFISKRIQMKFSSGKLADFVPQAEIPPSTQLDFFVRSSDIPFKENTPEKQFPFQKIISNKTSSSGFFATGKYYQWKAVFFSNANGSETPLLKGVSLTEVENPPPASPQNLQVVATTEDSVTLRFLRNSEVDVISGGRYHVYYGIEPYKPLGILRYKKVSSDLKTLIPFSNSDMEKTQDLRFQNYIQVKVSNETIKENIVYTRNHPQWIFDYPLLQKNIPLYFWVTALDNAYTEEPQHSDHESLPSNAVLVRPR